MLFSPLLGISFFGWIVQTAFFLVLALVAAALMPRQIRGVQRQLGRKPWASLGWGALAFFLVVPAILVVLVISIVGLLLVLPYGLFILLAYFFVTTGVGAFLAQKVLTGFGAKENLMLAVTIGVIGTTVVSRIPVIGPVLLIAMMIFGAGAALLGASEWRRGRRASRRGPGRGERRRRRRSRRSRRRPQRLPRPSSRRWCRHRRHRRRRRPRRPSRDGRGGRDARDRGGRGGQDRATEAVPAGDETPAAAAPEPPAAPPEPEAPAGPAAPEGRPPAAPGSSPDPGQSAT